MIDDSCQSTRRYNPQVSRHLRTHRRENLKSYKIMDLMANIAIAMMTETVRTC
jgi:hypothetical protein